MSKSADAEKSRKQLLRELAEARAALAAYEGRGGADGRGVGADGVLGRARDPIEIARGAVESLRRTDGRFLACLEHMVDCFAIFSNVRDASGAIVDLRYDYINKAGCEGNGLPLAGHLGRGIRELLSGQQGAAVFERYVKVVETGEPLELEAVEHEGGGRAVGRVFDVRAWKLDDGLAVAWRDVTERKRGAEAARAREAEARQGAMFESLPCIAWVNGPDGSVRHFNGRWAEFTGLAADPSDAAEWHAAYDAEDMARFLPEREAAVAAGRAYEAELRLRRRDGAYRWHLCRVVPVRDAGGTAVVAWLGSAMDIDDIRRAEGAVRESERRFRELAEAMPHMVWTLDADGNGTYGNAPFCAYAGVAPGTGFRRGELREMVHPDDRERAIGGWAKALAAGVAFSVEYRLRRAADGEYRWHLGRAVPVKDEGGNVVRWIGTATDIHEQKQGAERLAVLAAVFENSPDFIGMADVDGKVKFVNPAGRRMVGLGADEASVEGTEMAQYVAEWEAARLRDELVPALVRDGQVLAELSLRNFRTGQTFPALWHAFTVPGKDGRPALLATVSKDVSEARRVDGALREQKERLEAALAASGTGTFRWDIRTNGLTWDENLDRLFGLPPGRTARSLEQFLALVHGEDRAGVVDRCARSVEDGSDFDMEFRVVWPDGSEHWLADKGRTTLGADGRAAYMTGACVDVTAGKRAERAVRASEARFRQLADAMPQIVWTADASGRAEYFNGRWAEYTGMAAADALGEGFLSAVHPGDVEPGMRAWGRSLASGESLETEYRLRRADGTYRWQLVRAVPVRDEAGRVARWFGTCTDVHDFRLAMEEVREKQETLKLAQQVAGAGAFVWDVRAGLTWWSPELEAIYGIPVGSYRGTHEEWRALCHPEDAERAAAEVYTSLGTGTFVTDFRIVRPDGEVRWMHARARVFYDGDGRPARMVGVNFDVTDRRNAEGERERLVRQLEVERSRLAQVFMEAPAFMCVLRGERHVIEMANAQYLSLIGRRDIVGKALGEALPELQGQGFEKLLDDVLRTGKAHVGREAGMLLRRSPGGPLDEVFVDFVYHPLVEADGSVSGVFVHGAEVTEQVLARQRIEELAALAQRNLRQLEGVVNSVNHGVCVADADGRIVGMNRAALGMHGFGSAGEMMGEPAEYAGRFKLYDRSGVEVPQARWPVSRAVRGETVVNEELTLHRLDTGARRVASYSATPVRDADGRFELAVVSIHDLTEVKRVQAELELARAAAEEASRAKDRFMAMLSHELRTPLTPAMALLGEMLADERLPEEVRQDVAVARRNVELEVRLIDDLLDLTRIQNGKLEMRPRWVDVHEVVREAVRMVAPDVTAKRQRLETTFAAGKSNVRADAERLQQVLWNLLRNAVKFTPEGGSVNVVTENTAGGGIRVTVSDTGIGIAADVLPRLFKPFEQGRPTITRVFGGLGLGLAISQSIVRMHSGTLEAASDGPGKGSAFTFELPVAVAAVPKAEAAAPARAPQADGGRRLLLVEDHADTARVMGRLLKAKGYDVTTATSVKGGVDAAERARFDIVVSDVGLPDGSGLDLMRLLRQRYGLRGIALTGFGQESDVVAAKAAGFDAHLTKPIDVNRLLGLLEQIQGSARGGG